MSDFGVLHILFGFWQFGKILHEVNKTLLRKPTLLRSTTIVFAFSLVCATSVASNRCARKKTYQFYPIYITFPTAFFGARAASSQSHLDWIDSTAHLLCYLKVHRDGDSTIIQVPPVQVLSTGSGKIFSQAVLVIMHMCCKNSTTTVNNRLC